jgi:phosphatidylserine/phosphatidylglycerophosphate/cardiolipin synthase-like enzyme
MKLIVQPRDGISPLVSAIRSARKEIDLLIFRCDRSEIGEAIRVAVKRGVRVRTLISHTNHGGSKQLRKLEQVMLAAGATVSRTGNEFVRYHGKMMIVDRRTLWLLGFNLTRLDIKDSRTFGVITRQKSAVEQALKLFEADFDRKPYGLHTGPLVVSPENARSLLANMIAKARRQLLIYDCKVSDRVMIELLRSRIRQSVDVRIIGKVGSSGRDLPNRKYAGKRLHVRAIVRDGRDAFLGSQSLRTIELEKRREVGLIIRGGQFVRELVEIFEEDWAAIPDAKSEERSPGKHEPAA